MQEHFPSNVAGQSMATPPVFRVFATSEAGWMELGGVKWGK
jgi:hypothetical protein